MPVDFLTLLRRDHADLQTELTQLLDPSATIEQLRQSLDGVRLGLYAHAEAQDIVLARFERNPTLLALVMQAGSAHLAQERALSTLVGTRLGSGSWCERAIHLRELVNAHAASEEESLLPALRSYPADYSQLAGAYATERLRQLAMLQPSAPIDMRVAAIAAIR